MTSGGIAGPPSRPRDVNAARPRRVGRAPCLQSATFDWDSNYDMSFCSFFGGEVYKDNFKTGLYVCAKCDHQLFNSRSKYEHSSPWPAFTETIHEDSVAKHLERPGAFKVRCGKCGNGLGHEFVNDGPSKGLSRF